MAGFEPPIVKVERPGEGRTLPEWQTGTRQDYLEYIRQNSDSALTEITKGVRKLGESAPFENYTREWLSDPKKGASFIRVNWPKAKGFESFVSGLEKDPKDQNGIDNPDFQESYQMLQAIIDILKDRDSRVHEARASREKLYRREGVISETLKEGTSNLIRRFKEGSTTEKALIVVAIGVVIQTLRLLKDKSLFGSRYTVGALMKLGLAGWAINAISGKVSKDGKTLLQRIDVGTPLEDVRSSVWGLFALDGEQAKQQLVAPEEHKVMFAFGPKDIKKITDVYVCYPAGTKNELSKKDLVDMGFSVDEAGGIDGKVAYKVVDKLFKRAGKNYFSRFRVEEALRQGIKPDQLKLEDTGKTFEDFGHMAMREKYLSGRMAMQKWTFEEVMVEEMEAWSEVEGGIEKLYTKVYGDFDKAKLSNQTITAAAEIASMAAGHIADAGKWTGKKLWDLGGKITEGFKGAYEFADRQFQRLSGKYKEDEMFLQSIVDDVQVTGPGQVTVMGYPTTFTKSGSGDQIIYTIEGVTLGPAGDDRKMKDSLTDAISTKVRKAAEAAPLKGKDKLKFDNLTWDKTNRMWYVDEFSVRGNRDFKIEQTKVKLEVRFDEEGKARFEVEEQRVTDLDKINEHYVFGVIAERVRYEISALNQIAPGIPVDIKARIPIRISEVTKTTAGDTIAKGDIGGSKFVFRDDGKFLDPVWETWKGIDAIKISKSFVEAKVKQVASAVEFHRPFEEAQHVVENTRNVPDSIKAKWKYLVAFKQTETLKFFEDALKQAGNFSEIEKIQERHIGVHLTRIQNAANEIYALAESERPKLIEQKLGNMELLLYERSDTKYQDEYKSLMAEVLHSGRYKLGVITPLLRGQDDQEVVNKIRNVWSHYTRKFAETRPLDGSGDKNLQYLRKVKREILATLDEMMTKGLVPGRITSSELYDDPTKW